MALNIRQSLKMAWKSIWGKKGRSFLTILSIFIGIAAVMTIVSIMEGMQRKTMEQYEAMGSNRINVEIWQSFSYAPGGGEEQPQGTDYFPALYNYCQKNSDLILGVTPKGQANATVIYGTKSSDNMQPEYDENYNLIGGSYPPNLYYGSDQFSICENMQIKSGRDITALDMENYNQICVMSELAARSFFGSADPVGQEIQVNGNKFRVVGVYASRMDMNSEAAMWQDNMIVFPYTARRVLGGETFSQFLVKAKSAEVLDEAIARLRSYTEALAETNGGSGNVFSESKWAEQAGEQLAMMGLVMGGIAAISLLVGGIGIMNIMLVTVTERTREIGIRRAIGAQRASIVAQFLIEAAMLCGLGGLMGIVVGTIGSVALSPKLVQMTVYPSAKVALGAVGLSVGLGVIFGSYPAIKASKLQPVEALRAE